MGKFIGNLPLKKRPTMVTKITKIRIIINMHTCHEQTIPTVSGLKGPAFRLHVLALFIGDKT